MGGTSKSQTYQSSETNPWDEAIPAMQSIMGKLSPMIANSGLTGTESGALDTLQQSANAGNPFAEQIGSFANSLLNGGGANAQAGNVAGNLAAYRDQILPYANGSMVGNNPALKAQLDQIMTDVGNSVNSQFAAAGRDMSGANQQAYGRGVAAGVAPVLANQYNQDVNNQINAAGSLYGAGNTTASTLAGFQQQDQANRLQGVSTAQSALDAKNYGANTTMNIEAARRSIPAETLALLAQIGIPIAGLGSQSSGESNTTQKMSGAQQFATIANGIGNLMPKAPLKFG